MKWLKFFLIVALLVLSNMFTYRISYFLGSVNCDDVEVQKVE